MSRVTCSDGLLSTRLKSKIKKKVTPGWTTVSGPGTAKPIKPMNVISANRFLQHLILHLLIRGSNYISSRLLRANKKGYFRLSLRIRKKMH